MFSIQGVPGTAWPPLSQAAGVPARVAFAAPPGARTYEFQRELASFGGEVATALRDGSAIEGRMQAASLRLITHLAAWPQNIPIRLHTTRDDSGRRYDPRGTTPEHIDPIRIQHRRDGHYIAFRWLGASEYSLDCGAHPDSLFEAVLAGLQHHDGTEHTAFVAALRAGQVGGETDAQSLRQALLDFVERNPAALDALESVVLAGDRAKQRGKVDARSCGKSRRWAQTASGPSA